MCVYDVMCVNINMWVYDDDDCDAQRFLQFDFPSQQKKIRNREENRSVPKGKSIR